MVSYEKSYFRSIRKVYFAPRFSHRLLHAVKLFGRDVPFAFEQKRKVSWKEPGAKWFPLVAKTVCTLGAEKEEMVRSFFREAEEQELKLQVYGKYLLSYLQARFIFRQAFSQR